MQNTLIMPLLFTHAQELARHSKITAHVWRCGRHHYNFWHGWLICLPFVLVTHEEFTVPCLKNIGTTVPRFGSAVPDFFGKRYSRLKAEIHHRLADDF